MIVIRVSASAGACDHRLRAEHGQPGFALAQPFNKKPATIGNGCMVAFEVKSPAQVDALYKKAIALGGTDEGPPGDRGDGYYGAYFRDLDGNKVCVFKMG